MDRQYLTDDYLAEVRRQRVEAGLPETVTDPEVCRLAADLSRRALEAQADSASEDVA